MIPYDKNFDPPAMILSVFVAGVVHRRPRIELSALIDTGADVTAVPQSVVEKLKLYPIGRLQLEDANAVKTPVFTYEARLSLPQKSTKKMEVLLTPYPFIILGRDWLQDYYFCVRGERFSDGHWAAMLENGRIQAILKRLQVLREEME